MLWLLKPFSLAILYFSASCYGRPKDNRQVKPCRSKYRAVAYYANWAIYDRKFFPKDLLVTSLTHVLYAFANVNPETGEVFLSDETADTVTRLDDDIENKTGDILYGCLGQLYALKKANRNLKVLLSIGGSTYSPNFAGPISTDSGRAMFTSSAISLVKNLGLDGLDINWEYPDDDTQATNLVLLLQEIRECLDHYGSSLNTNYHFELTFASPAGPLHYQRLKQSEMDQYLDFWNLMAYDYTGSWSTVTGHQANIFPGGDTSTPFDTETAVNYYVSEGIPSEKIVLGMPLYGRSFVQTRGLDQPFGGTGEGSWEKGVYDFKSLPLPGSSLIYDAKLGASWSWDLAKQELISYDTMEVARQKVMWIQTISLGGVMWWEGSADKGGDESLIEGVVRALGACIKQDANNMEFPDSPYANIRGPPLAFSAASVSTSSYTSSDSKSAFQSASSSISAMPSSSVSSSAATSNPPASSTSTAPVLASSTCGRSLASNLVPAESRSPNSATPKSEASSTRTDGDSNVSSEQSSRPSTSPSISYITTTLPTLPASTITITTVVSASTE